MWTNQNRGKNPLLLGFPGQSSPKNGHQPEARTYHTPKYWSEWSRRKCTLHQLFYSDISLHWRQERNLVLQKMQISESLASVLVVLSIAHAAYTKLWNPELARWSFSIRVISHYDCFQGQKLGFHGNNSGLKTIKKLGFQGQELCSLGSQGRN